MNHPVTPLASAEVGHDTVSIELLEPADLPLWCGLFGRCRQA